GLYVVADGMGGHAAGEIASQEATDTVRGMVLRDRARLDAIASGDLSRDSLWRAVRLLESAAQAATYMIYGLAQHSPEQKGMGTTLSVLAIAGPWAITAQVGDSRVYLLREGRAVALTEDHTLIAYQLKHGLITPQEAAVSPHRNAITRSVGSREYVEVDTRVTAVLPGDRFLVCSDGLHGYLEDDELPDIIALGPEAAVHRLVALANQRGGRDNITAVVVAVDAE